MPLVIFDVYLNGTFWRRASRTGAPTLHRGRKPTARRRRR